MLAKEPAARPSLAAVRTVIKLAGPEAITALALLPIALGGDRPGQEIEHPMAVVILGGLVSSTLLNLAVVPALFLRFGGLPPGAPAES